MKLKLPLNLQNAPTFEDLRRYVSLALNDIATAINGSIDLEDNCQTALVVGTFPTANVDTAVSHTLGKTPKGFLVIGSNTGAGVYNGSTTNTDTKMYLRVTAAPSVITLLVF